MTFSVVVVCMFTILLFVTLISEILALNFGTMFYISNISFKLSEIIPIRDRRDYVIEKLRKKNRKYEI